MKIALALAAPLFLGLVGASCAAKPFTGVAQHATLVVDTSDLDLTSEAGIQRLSLRIQLKIDAICGSRHKATRQKVTMSNVMGLYGLERRKACIDTIEVSPRTAPVVRAYEAALAQS